MNIIPYGERRSKLEETITKYLEEAAKRQKEQDDWLKEFQKSTNKSLDSHDRSLKNLEATIGRLSDKLHKRQVIRNRSMGTCMALVTKDDIKDWR